MMDVERKEETNQMVTVCMHACMSPCAYTYVHRGTWKKFIDVMLHVCDVLSQAL